MAGGGDGEGCEGAGHPWIRFMCVRLHGFKAYGASVAHRWRIAGRSMFSLTLVRLVCLCEAVAGVGLVSYFTVVSPLKRLH